MMSSLPWAQGSSESEWKRAARHAAATLLQRGAGVLARTAQRLSSAQTQPEPFSRVPVLEFHAEAGALEGALYVDGRLVGHLEGITRL